MQKITPFLWFDTQAEEAARFYTSLLPDSEVLEITHYPEGTPGPAGEVMMVHFKLAGQEFFALNAGPTITFNESISLMVAVETQEELDRLWDALTDGGEEVECGWLKDRYGLFWQITPTVLMEMVSSGDAALSGRVMAAMMKMRKLDIATLKAAAEAG